MRPEIGTQCDEARHRGDERPHPADVHPEQERPPVGGKAREQDRRRHIGDELAGQGRDQQRVTGEERREKRADRRDTHHVPRENEKTDKGQEQRIIHGEERPPVGKEQYRHHRRECHIIREQAEHGEDHEQKHPEIERGAPPGQRRRCPLPDADRLPREKDEAQHRDDRHRDEKWRQHRQRKSPRRNVKIAVQIQVLRVAERGQHPAEVGGGVLEDERERHVPLLPRRGEDIAGKRQEREERHIVRDEHGADKGDVGEREHTGAERPRQGDDLLREHRKEPDMSQCRHHRKGRKQAGERREINIGKVLPVWRHEAGRHDRRTKCNEQDHVVPCKPRGNTEHPSRAPLPRRCRHPRFGRAADNRILRRVCHFICHRKLRIKTGQRNNPRHGGAGLWYR